MAFGPMTSCFSVELLIKNVFVKIRNMTLKMSISSVEWYFLYDMGEKSTLVDFFPYGVKSDFMI